MKKGKRDKLGYFTFTLIALLLVIIGVLMNVFNYSSSYDIGLKYGPSEKSSITGDLVIILGAILLVGVFLFYLIGRRKKCEN